MPTKNPPLLAPYIKFLTKDGTLSEFTGDSGALMINRIEYTDLVAIDDECGGDEIVGEWRKFNGRHIAVTNPNRLRYICSFHCIQDAS